MLVKLYHAVIDSDSRPVLLSGITSEDLERKVIAWAREQFSDEENESLTAPTYTDIETLLSLNIHTYTQELDIPVTVYVAVVRHIDGQEVYLSLKSNDDLKQIVYDEYLTEYWHTVFPGEAIPDSLGDAFRRYWLSSGDSVSWLTVEEVR